MNDVARYITFHAVAALVLLPGVAGASHLAVTAIPSDTWIKEPGVRIDHGPAGSPDSGRASTPHVIRSSDGTWRMYYAGNASILSAVSVDGLSWTKEPGIRVPVGSPGQLGDVAHPFVMPGADGELRMYYECSDDGVFYDTCSAVSGDGLAWAIEAGIRLAHGPPGAPDSHFAADPIVIEVSEGLMMYYSAFDNNTIRIMSALSGDGLHWLKEAGVRVDSGPPGSADQLGASHFYIVQRPDGAFLMYYAGTRILLFGDSILSAISTDHFTWTKEPGTRVGLGPPGSFDDTRVLQPSIVQLPDGRFRMYYTGFREDGPRILSAVALAASGGGESIPTLSEWGQLLLVASLIGAAWLALRRNRGA